MNQLEFDKMLEEIRVNNAKSRALLAQIRPQVDNVCTQLERLARRPEPDEVEETKPETQESVPFLPGHIASDARKDATRAVLGHAFVIGENLTLGYLAGWAFIGIVGVWCLISMPNGDLTEEIGLGIVYHSLWTTAILIVLGVLWFGREQPLRERVVLIFKLALQFALALAAIVALIRIFNG